MALKKDEVFASLEAIKSPEGLPLLQTGNLSDVIIEGGEVFLSISVDTGLVPAWEPHALARFAAWISKFQSITKVHLVPQAVKMQNKSTSRSQILAIIFQGKGKRTRQPQGQNLPGRAIRVPGSRRSKKVFSAS